MNEILNHFAVANCSKLLGFPTWYEYLKGTCSNIEINGVNDVWLMVAR